MTAIQDAERPPKARDRMAEHPPQRIDRSYELRPCPVESADLRHQHIVEHTASGTVPGQSGTKHGRTRATSMAVAVYQGLPRHLLHGFYLIRAYSKHAIPWYGLLDKGRNDHGGYFRTLLEHR